MNFAFSDEQLMLKDQARKLLARRVTFAGLRRFIESGRRYDDALWAEMAAMGWLGTAIPEEYGGLGLGGLEQCVLAEEIGRAVAPVPFASSICLAAEAIKLCGSEDQNKRFLPKLASGDLIGTFAFAEGPSNHSEKRIVTSFTSGRLNGRKLPIPDGDIAHLAVVVAKRADGTTGLALAELAQPGVRREPVEALDLLRSHATISFDNAPAEPLGEPREASANLKRIYDRAATFAAFEQIGGADACLEMGRAYALERFTFGRPIASYQAIRHRLADMFVKIELARSNAYFAAWALAHDASELGLAAATARLSASEAYEFAARENLQIHGGIGYTWEANCHFFYRRARYLAVNLGSVSRWSDRLISEIESRNVLHHA